MNTENLKLVPDFLKGTFKEYRNYTRYHAKSFYFSSFILPKEKRNAAYAVYAFCRFADNITDVNRYESEDYMKRKIEYLKITLDEIYRQAESEDEFISDFSLALKKYKIPKKLFLELIDGVATDITKKRYATYSELEDYCYKVASVVGLIMTYIFGYKSEKSFEYAVALGKAMQLTNILRDIKDDYNIGRIYIPEEDLKRFSYYEKDIAEGKIDSRFIELMRFQINRARDLYAFAENGIALLENDGSQTAVRLMSRIYSAILDEIEKSNYDIYSKRHYVSSARKISIALKIMSGNYEGNDNKAA